MESSNVVSINTGQRINFKLRNIISDFMGGEIENMHIIARRRCGAVETLSFDEVENDPSAEQF